MQKNTIDLARPFYEAVSADPSLPEIHAFGGIVTAALIHPDTRVAFDEQRIIAPHDLKLPQFRDKAGKDMRDIDTLVWTSDKTTISEVESMVDKTVGAALKKSTFGVHTLEELDKQFAKPWQAFLRTFVSDRYGALGSSSLVKAAFPFVAPIPEAAQTTWTLAVGELEIPTSHPAALISNYLTRSIAGLRPKDAKKVHTMVANLHRIDPRLTKELKSGVAESQLELGGILRRMGSVALRPQLILGDLVRVPNYTMRQLRKHEANKLADSPESELILQLMHLKATIWGRGESMQPIVDYWQRLDLENRVPNLVHNDCT